MLVASSALSPQAHDKFEVYNWRNALELLFAVHGPECMEIDEVLRDFTLKHSDLATGGGNKSKIARSLDEKLYAMGWVEKAFDTRIVVDGHEYVSPTHKVDCFKNRVALEVEWNNKDPFSTVISTTSGCSTSCGS